MKSSLPLALCGVALMSAWMLEGCKNGSVPNPGEEDGGSAAEGGSDGGGTAGSGATAGAGGSATPGAYAGEGGTDGGAGAPSDAGAPGAAGSEDGGAPAFDPTLFRGHISLGFSNTRADVVAQLDAEIWPVPTTPLQEEANAAYLEYLAQYQMLAAADGECSEKPEPFLGFDAMGETIDVGTMFTASAGAMELATATALPLPGGGGNPYSGGLQLGALGLPGTVEILGPGGLGMQPNPLTVRIMDLGFEDNTIEWLSTDEEFLLSLFFDGEWDEDDEGEAYFIVSIGDYQCKFYPPATVGNFTVGIPRDVVETLPQYFGNVQLRPVVFKDAAVSGGGFVRVETGVYLGNFASGTFN